MGNSVDKTEFVKMKGGKLITDTLTINIGVKRHSMQLENTEVICNPISKLFQRPDTAI